jgi:hypothetical protein
MDQDGSISIGLYYLHQRRKRQKERTKSFGREIRDSIEAETAVWEISQSLGDGEIRRKQT